MAEAFLYHFHGLGSIDFSRLAPEDLPEMQRLAAAQDIEILPTVYLRREALPRLVATVREYGRLRAAGELPNVAGFAVEGPLLGPQGGIPRAGMWFPTAREWAAIAELGEHGLKYIVIAPDAMDLEDVIEPQLTFADLLTDFYGHGVRAALGHFYRHDPARSAARMDEVLRFLHERYESSPFLVLTDHLYNDMPRDFTHAWRTAAERERRAVELAPLTTVDWNTADLHALLGPVPATMLAAARDGLLMPCINFDGYHVDLEIVRRTFDHLGPDRLIVLTDHTEVGEMAQEPLTRDEHSGLWLRDDGKVAAGSAGWRQQQRNMRAIGLSDMDIRKLFVTNPKAAIEYPVRALSRV